ncbi:MAG: right-handed parallel beta-helix repeat-containing protein [Thermoguttaceae bacterium]|nr:right-handed parallel beta-helix repeat-containing protein [Thermoguttaceae bacterium]
MSGFLRGKVEAFGWGTLLWVALALVWGTLKAETDPAGEGGRSVGQEASAQQPVVATFYVSTSGVDDAPGTKAKPFATIPRAQQAVRQWKRTRGLKGHILVLIGRGVYELNEPLAFGPEDGGEGAFRIIYQAEAPNEVVISGGRKIVDWREGENGVWEAVWRGKPFRQLYVAGKRAVRARSGVLDAGYDPSRWESLHDFSRGGALPDADFLFFEGFQSSALDMADWRNQTDIELVFVNVWAHMRYLVRELRREGDLLVVLMKQPQFLHGRAKEGVNVNLPAWVENARELLDEPGEWYLDRWEEKIFYRPRPGEDLTQAEVVAPQLERLVQIEGQLGRPVANIEFRGIVFSHANWFYPSEVGHADVQANFTLDSFSDRLMVRRMGYSSVHNEHRKSPGAVRLRYAEGIRFHRCTFTQCGSAALDIEQGSRGNQIVGCHFYDLSGSAIQIGDVLRDDHHPDDERKIVSDNSVENCLIHDCALDYMGGVGIFVGYTTRTRIVHNEICRLPYSGISVGWGWGEEDAGGGPEHYWQPFRYQTPTPSRENFIAFNHIHHVMCPMQDGGGIYTLGNQPGTVITGNYIHDNVGAPGGIYLDEGSGFIEVRGNLIHNVVTALNFNNHAQDRIATCRVEGNFVFEERPERFPPEADAILSQAGLEKPYRVLLEKLPEAATP